MDPLPTSCEVGHMLSAGTGEHLALCTRFPTGLCHFVFDVVAESGTRFVVRVARAGNEERIDGSVYWSARLRPIGIPLPEMLHRGVFAKRHFTILERLPGTDLDILMTLLFAERGAGELDDLFELVYHELRLIARRQLRRGGRGDGRASSVNRGGGKRPLMSAILSRER